MYNIEAKSLLAKLLSEENINVEFRKMSTAAFDLNNRTLYLPILKEGLSSNITDLFIGHEVGHALFTDKQQWNDCLSTHKKSIVNILEDIRIERKIQSRYQGLKPIFVSAYKQLNEERDFFKIQDINVNELNFLNRLNLYSKIGPSLIVDFTIAETQFVDKAFVTETFEDVLVLSKEIEEYLKEKQHIEEQEENSYNETEEDYSQENHEESEESSAESGDESENDYDSDEFETSNNSDYDFDEDGDEFSCSTLENLELNIESLVSDSCREHEYININILDSSKFIIDHKNIIKNIKQYYTIGWQFGGGNELYFKNTYVKYNEFLAKNSKTIQFMINEFNVKRNAKALRKNKLTKTGNLDIQKLQNYKINDNIFRKIEVTDKEKSHGLILFLDWSGSMRPYLQDTIAQLLCLLVFCKKLSIPFEVYAFSTFGNLKHGTPLYETPKNILGSFTDTSGFSLMNLLSSKMSDNEFKFMANLLCSLHRDRLDISIFEETSPYFKMANKSSYYGFSENVSISVPGMLEMNRTPLDDTIIAAMDIIPKFKQQMKLDKVHTIFLTDGETSPNLMVRTNERCITFVPLDGSYNRSYFVNKVFYFREPKSKITKRVNITGARFNQKTIFDVSSTITLFQLLKEYVDDNIVSYRIIEPRDLKGRVDYYFDDKEYVSEEFRQKLKKQLTTKKYISVENQMHTKSFLIQSSSLAMDDEDYTLDKDSSVKKMASTFSKSITNKTTNRIFLQDFIGMIL